MHGLWAKINPSPSSGVGSGFGRFACRQDRLPALAFGFSIIRLGLRAFFQLCDDFNSPLTDDTARSSSSRSSKTWTHLGPRLAFSRQRRTISRTASLLSVPWVWVTDTVLAA